MPSISYAPLASSSSTFLDYTSYGTTDATNVLTAYGITHPVEAPASATINVALVLPRANDPTALLQEDWATRQTTLAQLNANHDLWSTYGASQSAFSSIEAFLTSSTSDGGLGLTVIGDATGTDGYITSAESRTIWVQLSSDDFQTLFNATLYQNGDLTYWQTGLSLPTQLADVQGLWFDFEMYGPKPAASNLFKGTPPTPTQGAQSIGNGLGTHHGTLFASQIASDLYNFPLADVQTPTVTIGVLEPGSGDVLDSSGQTFQQLLDNFRQQAGIFAPASYVAVENGGTSYQDSNPGERSLDVAVLSTASPNSTLVLYAGSGFAGSVGELGAGSNVFTAYQAAFWDSVNNPAVVSASYGLLQQAAPGSPFATAAQELFIDAALSNITVLQANNDYGSSWGFANGLANQSITLSSPYNVLVGGTSLATLTGAPLDPTLSKDPTPAQSVYGLAIAKDPQTIWTLVEGGLSMLPSTVAPATPATFLESVWNDFTISGTTWTGGGIGAGDGGVDTTQPTPWYQTAFGLTPTSVSPAGESGRGAPDVTANAGGDLLYKFPGADMQTPGAADGTSAAAPLWSALIAQIDTVFQDQGLPNLGFATDLLYIAAAIAPASFNDITFGNNISAYHRGGSFTDGSGKAVTLTGLGYSAEPGYDLTSGLGSPNGMLLARALTEIAHVQMSFGSEPNLINPDGAGGWTSGADQTLLLQATGAAADIEVTSGSHVFRITSRGSDSFAWTSRLAEQSLQPDFDPNLVRLFDHYAQGAVGQTATSSGSSIAVTIGGDDTLAPQATLTNSYGFADFVTGGGALRLALPVAVAETAGGADGQVAIARLRQNGQDSVSVSFYRVDDLSGSIDGLSPGDAGYAAAAQERAYQLTSGGTAVNGPGYGNFVQTELLAVNAGDLVAMTLTNISEGNVYWAFSQGNEIAAGGGHVGHLWNYSSNSWGWEDTEGGGDHDYNDLVVGLDFTSASGHGWLS